MNDNRKIQQRLDRLMPAQPRTDRAEVVGVGVFIFLACLVAALMFALSGCAPAVEAATEPAATATAGGVFEVKRPATPSPVPSPTPDADTCIVSTGYELGTVNVRSGPGMIYPVVDVVAEGEALIVHGPIKDGWRAAATLRLVEGFFYVERWCK